MTNEKTTDSAASALSAGLGGNTAAMTLARAGVYAGAHGLEGLANAMEFWERQPYGTRLYYGPGLCDYLQIGVLRTAVKLLADMTPNAELRG
jgi:hypothetical protein